MKAPDWSSMIDKVSDDCNKSQISTSYCLALLTSGRRHYSLTYMEQLFTSLACNDETWFASDCIYTIVQTLQYWYILQPQFPTLVRRHLNNVLHLTSLRYKVIGMELHTCANVHNLADHLSATVKEITQDASTRSATTSRLRSWEVEERLR